MTTTMSIERDVERISMAARVAAREMLGSELFGRYSTLVKTEAGYLNVVVEANPSALPPLDAGLRAFLRAWGDLKVVVQSGSVHGGSRTHCIGELFAGALTNCTIAESYGEWEKLKARLV